MQTELCCAYVTLSSMEMAQSLGQQLIEERLAACINIYPEVHAIFRWEDKIENVSEVVMFVKTTMDKTAIINEKIKEITDYDMACLITYPIVDGNPEFLQWMRNEVQ